MVQDAGGKLLADRAQPIGPLRVVQHWPVGAVAQAEMDVGAVADPIGIEDRREDRALAQAMGHRARHLALDHRLVGDAQAPGRVKRHLVLPGAVFRQEAVGAEPGAAQCRHVGFAKAALAAPGVERIGRAGAVLDAVIDEFLFECGEQCQTGLGL